MRMRTSWWGRTGGVCSVRGGACWEWARRAVSDSSYRLQGQSAAKPRQGEPHWRKPTRPPRTERSPRQVVAQAATCVSPRTARASLLCHTRPQDCLEESRSLASLSRSLFRRGLDASLSISTAPRPSQTPPTQRASARSTSARAPRRWTSPPSIEAELEGGQCAGRRRRHGPREHQARGVSVCHEDGRRNAEALAQGQGGRARPDFVRVSGCSRGGERCMGSVAWQGPATQCGLRCCAPLCIGQSWESGLVITVVRAVASQARARSLVSANLRRRPACTTCSIAYVV